MSETASQTRIISDKFQRLLNTFAVDSGKKKSGYTKEFFTTHGVTAEYLTRERSYFIDKLS